MRNSRDLCSRLLHVGRGRCAAINPPRRKTANAKAFFDRTFDPRRMQYGFYVRERKKVSGALRQF